jgi:hypothetical protein
MSDYIDRDKIDISGKGFKNYDDYSHYIDLINEQPSVDAVEVVRCKDCKHKYYDFCKKFMQKTDMGVKGHLVKDTDYCKWGEKE